MSDDLIKRLRKRKKCIGFKSHPSKDGGHMVCAAQYGPDPLTTEAAALIARQQALLDRALEASFNDKARADRLEDALRGDEIMPQHVIRVAAALIDALHVLDTEAIQIAGAINRSGGVDGVQVLEDAEKIIKAAAGLLASEMSGVPHARSSALASPSMQEDGQ